jgi:hypothetical protein
MSNFTQLLCPASVPYREPNVILGGTNPLAGAVRIRIEYSWKLPHFHDT